MIVEGIGFDSFFFMGEPFRPYIGGLIETGDLMNLGLHHVEDASGKVIYRGLMYDQQPYRLMDGRNGSVWHYLYGVDGKPETYRDLKYSFREGTRWDDMLFVCYSYFGDSPQNGELTGEYTIENNKKTVLIKDPEVIPLPEIQLDPPQDRNFMVYDFEDFPAYVAEHLPGVTITAQDSVIVERQPARRYILDRGDGKHCAVVEGIGIDAESDNGLFTPFNPPSTDDGPKILGLAMVTDRNGNVTYKGVNFNKMICLWADQNGDTQVDLTDMSMVIDTLLRQADSPKADINGDGVIDIVDLNMLINLILE